MTSTYGSDPYHGHESAERLEYWLDGQLDTGNITLFEAQLMLPGYRPHSLSDHVSFDIPSRATTDTADDADEW